MKSMRREDVQVKKRYTFWWVRTRGMVRLGKMCVWRKWVYMRLGYQFILLCCKYGEEIVPGTIGRRSLMPLSGLAW
jgi:hypothetical protein